MNPKRIISLAIVCGVLAIGGSVAGAAEDSTDALIAKLASTDQAVQLKAIDHLGAKGEDAAAAVAPLAALLKSKSATIRAHAADALQKIGPKAKPAAENLVELLKDPNVMVRGQAIEALVSIRPGPHIMVPLCVKLLEDSEPDVRLRVLSAIADAGPRAIPGLIEALKNDKAAYWVCLVLREMGPAAKDAVPALAEKLQDADPEIRREVILTLAAIEEGAVSAVPQIVKTLNDEHTNVAATYALGRIGQIPADAEIILRANSKSEDKMLGTTSLWALARVHPDDAALRREAGEQLIARLKDQDAFVRAAAARALAALPPAPEIMAPLWEKAFQDADEMTVLHALDALVATGPQAVPRLINALKHEKIRVHVIRILGKMGPAAAPAAESLANLVADKNERVSEEAAMALGGIGPGAKAAVPALIEALQQGDSPNAHAIVYALGKIGPDAAAAEPVLDDLLKRSSNLSLVNAWALTRICPPSEQLAAKTVPLLVAGLADSFPPVRHGAAEALGNLGPAAKPALPALQAALNDKDEGVRSAAAKAIAAIRGNPQEQ